MIRPMRFLIGYEIISADGANSAKLINICSGAGIAYSPLGFFEGRLKIRVAPIAAARLKIICEKHGVALHTEEKHGLPFVLAEFFSRPGLVLGSVLCVLMIIFSGRVVWDIRVVGNSAVSTENIISVLEECGFGVGTEKAGLELDKLENRFLILSDEISWISVNITGTVAEVEVRELQSEPEPPNYAASNLVAARNGTVVGFEEVKGNISVELGEAVSEGELLVGGVYGSEDTALRFVRASGQVMALCERDYSIEIPLEYDGKEYTGEQKIKKSLIFFKKEVKLFGNSGNLYTSCDIIDEVKYLNFFGLGDIPVGIRTVRQIEYRTVTAERTENEARAQAVFELWQRFYEDAPDAQLVEKTLEEKCEGGCYVLSATVESIENIAEEREIKLDLLSFWGKRK